MSRSPLFSRPDRIALLFVEWLAVVALVFLWAYSYRSAENAPPSDSLAVKTLEQRRKHPPKYTYAVEEIPFETFPFDPNTADSTTLLRLGLAPWQVRTIYKYRAKHGRYHQAEDFKRLPGMTPELWERLKDYITIDEKYQYLSSPKKNIKPNKKQDHLSSRSDQDTLFKKEITSVSPQPTTKQAASSWKRDTVLYPKKFKEHTLVDINLADSQLLKRIPSIGSYRARQIIAYREQLGGYTHVEQAMESCQLPDEVLEWFTLSANPTIKKICINNLTIKQLMRHPYISFYQARSIVEYRKEKGKLNNSDELRSLEHFTHNDIERLKPYLDFE